MHMRQKYQGHEGWGGPYGEVYPFGRWDAMWKSRGPLEVVPHPRNVKEEPVDEKKTEDVKPTSVYQFTVPMPTYVREFFERLTEQGEVTDVRDGEVVFRIEEDDTYALGHTVRDLEATLSDQAMETITFSAPTKIENE